MQEVPLEGLGQLHGEQRTVVPPAQLSSWIWEAELWIESDVDDDVEVERQEALTVQALDETMRLLSQARGEEVATWRFRRVSDSPMWQCLEERGVVRRLCCQRVTGSWLADAVVGNSSLRTERGYQ